MMKSPYNSILKSLGKNLLDAKLLRTLGFLMTPSAVSADDGEQVDANYVARAVAFVLFCSLAPVTFLWLAKFCYDECNAPLEGNNTGQASNHGDGDTKDLENGDNGKSNEMKRDMQHKSKEVSESTNSKETDPFLLHDVYQI